MTSLAIIRRRTAIRLATMPLEALVCALILLGAMAAGVLGWREASGSRAAPAATIVLPAAQAEALVAATTISAGQIGAVGDEAKAINAALPFSGNPVEAANPFAMAGGDLDHRRALLCLTQAVYYEAGFEPMAGRRAVAQVVLNRMRHPAFPKSVCGVVYQGSRSPVCQFSFVCDGSLYRAPATVAWRQSREIAEAALGGYVESQVGAATHYHADYVAPRWAPKLAKITKLGAHIFYRWPGLWGQRSAFSGRYIGEPQDSLALRPALRTDPATLAGDRDILATAADSGPPVARAPNDVGGLLDTSKGWALAIPLPGEIDRQSSRAIARQEAGLRGPVTAMAATAPIAGSR